METLLTLLQHAQAERDRARAAYEAALAAQRATQAQAQMLLAYRREYESRWSRQFSEYGEMELVRSYHGFMQRLTHAVDHQQSADQHADEKLAAAQALWRTREIRLASIRKLIERRQAAARSEHQRRDQKLSDELATRALLDALPYDELTPY